MRPNAILAFSAGYDVDKLAPFVASWKRNVPSSRLLIFYTNTSAETIETLTAHGVEFIDIERYWPSPYRGITLRFIMWRDHVREFGSEFEKIMLADIRDVIFQSDPFSAQIERAVVWASEDKTLRSDPNWNLRWLQELFGSDAVEEFADQYASCCGTILGTLSGMSSYLEDLCNLIEQTEFDRMGVYEQGFHNYLIHRMKPDYGFLDLEFNIFATLGTVPASRITTNGHLVLVDQRAPPVIHQWDRHGSLVRLMNEDENYRLPG